MNVTIDDQTGYVVAHVSGSLDSVMSDQFAKEVRPIVEQRATDLFLDLSRTDYVNSEGLARIIELHRAARKQSRHVVLISPVPGVRDILRMTKLDTYLPVVDCVDDAIAHSSGH